MNDETNAGNTLKSLIAEREERREGKAGGPQQFLSALNEGLATLAGAPVDVVNFALRQIGIPTDPMHPFGGEALREGFRKWVLFSLMNKYKEDTLIMQVGWVAML